MFKIALVLTAMMFLAACGGKSTQELYSEALEQMKGDNPGGAVVLLKTALDKDPNFFDARYQLAKAYVGTGKYEQAAKEYEKTIRQTPSRIDIRLELASLYNLLRKPDDAIKAAREYLKQKPDAPEALEAMGIGKALKKQYQEAEDHLLKAIQLGPDRHSARLALAEVYVLSGRQGEARLLLDQVALADPKNIKAHYLIAELENAAGKKEKALEVYKKIASINQTETYALYKAGLIHLERGENPKAKAIADDLLTRFPKRGEGSRLKGIVSFYDKDYQEAIQSLQNSLKMQPTLEGFYYLGLSLYSRGELESALSQFQRILDYDPSFTKARLLAAMVLLNQKRTDDAIAEARKVIQQDDRNALAYNILGSAQMAKGNYDEGMAALNRATSLDPGIVDAHLKKGLYRLSKGSGREAESDLKQAVRAAPDKLNGRLLLFAYYMRGNQFEKALAVAKEGLNGTRSDAILYNNMAAALFALKRQEQAVESLNKAEEADPAYLPGHFNMAGFYASKGDFDGALTEYGVILGKEPLNLKALLASAAIHEMRGAESEAFAMYVKGKETKQPAAYVALTRYHLRKKQTDQALAVLDEAAKAGSDQGAVLELKGSILLAEKKFSQALKIFDQLDSIQPGRGIPAIIQTYLLMNEPEKATEQARKAIALKPRSAEGYLLLASVFEYQGKLDAAVKEVESGLRTEQASIPARLKLGNLQMRLKNYRAASVAYSAVLASHPDAVPALFAMGVLLEETGKKREAVNKYKEALQHDDRHVPSLNNLANLYLSGLGSPQEALRLVSIAYQKEPENPNVLDTFGYALLKTGRKKEARQVLTKVASLLPDNPTVQYHLALACKECGERNAAVAQLRTLLKKGVDFPEQEEAKRLMTQLTSGRSKK